MDKQYRGQYYTFEEAKTAIKISLEDAVRQNLIDYRRFCLMNKEDATNIFKIIVKEKGLPAALSFVSDNKINLSEEELKELLL